MDFELYNRYKLSNYARNQHYTYEDESSNLDFQKYLDLWSFNPKLQQVSLDDEQITFEKLNQLKQAQYISKAVACGLMTLLYYKTDGFKTTLPWYFKYPRHLICIGIGTMILPKYLIGSRFSDYFKYFEDQQNKYKQEIENNKVAIEKQVDSFQDIDYLIQIAKQQGAQNLQSPPILNNKSSESEQVDKYTFTQNSDDRK